MRVGDTLDDDDDDILGADDLGQLVARSTAPPRLGSLLPPPGDGGGLSG